MIARLAFAALIILPVLWLFDVRHPPSTPIDYANAVWVAAYFGEYLREHWAIPIVLNTSQYTGVPSPGYYGYLLQPASGALSALIGGDLAIRALLIGSFAFQQVQVYRTIFALTGRRDFALAGMALVGFEIYPMSELYQAGRVAEFIARAWLLSAACLWVQCLADRQQRPGRLVLLGLCLTIAFGTHPVHVVYGGLLMLLAAALSFATARNRLAFLRDAAAVGAAVLVVLAPWLYLLRLYTPTTMVTVETPIYVAFDNPLVRLLPFPYSPITGSGAVDTQISIPLLLMALALGIGSLGALRERGSAGRVEALAGAGALAIAAYLFVLSVNWHAIIPVRPLFWTVQWVHRFVAFMDLLLFAAVCLFLLSYRSRGIVVSRASVWVGCAALGIACVALVLKLAQSIPVRDPLAAGTTLFGDRAALITHPYTVPITDYASKRGFVDELPAGVEANVRAIFPVGSGAAFGLPSPVTVAPLDGRLTAVITNVIAHPFSRLAVDGRLVPLSETFAVDAPLGGTGGQQRFGGVSVIVESALIKHANATVELREVPAPVWLVLRAVSLSVFALWVVLVVALRPLTRRRHLSS